MKKQLIKLTENDLHCIIRNVVKESLDNMDDVEERTQYDDYKEDYPNDDFSKEDIDIVELLAFIQKSGDFLYYFMGRMHAANSQDVCEEIYKDVESNGAEISDYLDSDLELRWDKFFGADDLYVVVFKAMDSEMGKPYYIVYERDRSRQPYSYSEE